MADKNTLHTGRQEWYLEQVLLGEASPELEASIAADPQASARLASLRSENEAFLKRYPASLMADQIRKRSKRQGWLKGFTSRLVRFLAGSSTEGQPARGVVFAMAGGLPLALVLGFLGLQAFVGSNTGFDDGTMYAMNDTRTKGMEQGLLVYRQEDAGSRELKNNSLVEDFGKIQIAFRPGDGNFGFIFSLDGRGRLTLHYPESFGGSMVMLPGSQTLLPFAYQLDDAPNFERFYLAVSKKDFNLQTVWSDLERQVDKIVQAGGSQLQSPPNLVLSGSFKTVYLDLRKGGGNR